MKTPFFKTLKLVIQTRGIYQKSLVIFIGLNGGLLENALAISIAYTKKLVCKYRFYQFSNYLFNVFI